MLSLQTAWRYVSTLMEPHIRLCFLFVDFFFLSIYVTSSLYPNDATHGLLNLEFLIELYDQYHDTQWWYCSDLLRPPRIWHPLAALQPKWLSFENCQPLLGVRWVDLPCVKTERTRPYGRRSSGKRHKDNDLILYVIVG
jgi:hypothetical protein